MRMLFPKSMLVAFVVLVAPSGCVASEVDLPSCLIVSPDAQDLYKSEHGDIRQVVYALKTKYPADEVINAIKERLRKLGWEPLKDDFLNPGLASSHSVGWQEFEDATITPPKHVHQWLAQWVNRDGDVTWYAFRYEYLRDGDPDLHTLTVMASYFPKDVAGMLKSTQHTAEPGHALDAHKDARE